MLLQLRQPVTQLNDSCVTADGDGVVRLALFLRKACQGLQRGQQQAQLQGCTARP